MRLLERGARRPIIAMDAVATRLYGWRWNPAHQAGTVAVAMLLVLLATGIYLLLWYRLGAPAASVARIAADPWLGSWMRSLHRYATDVLVIAAVLHALRLIAQGRTWGPRTLAWVSGLALFGAALVCAWTGFVMAWDSFGERLARDGGRLLDALPVFSEPLSRIFAGDGPVPSAFFFVNLFVHIALPLVMAMALWLHVSRVARPALLPPKPVLWTIIGALIVASVVLPAPLGQAANPLTLPRTTPTDLVVAWWLPLSESRPPVVVWMAILALAIAALLVPRAMRQPREGALAPSVVDPRLCTGCNQCPQDCPWDAITMVPRDDDRPTLMARVDASHCVSCGICAGSCAPMGVGPPGRSGRDQLAAARALPAFAHTDVASIVAVVCEYAAPGHANALGRRGAVLHAVSCAGNVHTSLIEFFVKKGAPGVIIVGCPPRDCVSREGPKWLHERVFNDREAELQPRVDRRRVCLATSAPGDLAGLIAEHDAFVKFLATLDQPERVPDLPIDFECEPVLTERAVT